MMVSVYTDRDVTLRLRTGLAQPSLAQPIGAPAARADAVLAPAYEPAYELLDRVEIASLESFPASDPPGWIAGHV